MLTLKELGVVRKEAALPNGVRIVVFERPAMPVSMCATIFGGSRFDGNGKEGMAHFLEHMLVAGTKTYPSKDKLAAAIERYGGLLSASTWLDDVNINVSIGDPNDLSHAFDILHETLTNSLFNTRVLELERGAILSELRDTRSNPGKMVKAVAEGLFFQGTELAKPVLGTIESVQNITREDILDAYHTRVSSGRTLLIASGDMTLNQMAAGAEQALRIPASAQFKSSPVPIRRDTGISIERYPGQPQTHFVFGFRTVSDIHPDAPVLAIIAEILGGGRASILARKLRYEKGLVYSVAARQIGFAGAGMWVVKTSVAKDQIQEVLDIIANEVRRVVESGLSSEELRFAKEKITKSKRLELQSSSSWVRFHAHHQLISDTPWAFIDYMREVEAATEDDTKRVAQAHFKPNSWYLALCGDIEEEDIRISF